MLDSQSLAALQQLKDQLSAGKKNSNDGSKKSYNSNKNNSNNETMSRKWDNLKDGVVKATDKGYGFLEMSNGESVFIPPYEMKKVFHGDRISAAIEEDKQGRKQASPRILNTPSITSCVGRIYFNSKNNNYQVEIDEPGYHNRIFTKVPNKIKQLELHDGDWVIVELSDHPLLKPEKPASLIVKELIARQDDPKVPWLVSLRRYDLPTNCPPDPENLELKENYTREDMTNIPFVTIDSPTTKDMDDAISITDHGEYWELFVAIADPTAYITYNSPMDNEAAKRAFTCYLPGFNIPVIPHVMSEGVCSLVQGETRPALVAQILVNKDGSHHGSDPCTFKIATVMSHARLAYDDVSDYIEKDQKDKLNCNEQIENELRELANFAKERALHRSKTTVLFDEKPDFDIELDQNGKPIGVTVEYRRTANKIVEEAMIIANECAGNFLAQKLGTGIFNRHVGFDADKLDLILKILSWNNITEVTKEDLTTMEGYFKVRKIASTMPTRYLDMRLKKLHVPAEIVIKPAQHFGLGLNNYATWTSPIRKYGDMINHRLIKSIITSNQQIELPSKEIIANLNNVKKVNRYAERDVNDWLYIDILSPEIAKQTIYDAEISDISRGGIKAQLLANGATVFIPFSFVNPEKSQEIVANNEECRIYKNGQVFYELAMKIKVKLKDTDRMTRNITAEIVE